MFTLFGASLFKMDVTTQKILRVIDLKDIEEIQMIKENPAMILFKFKNCYRRQYYKMQEAKNFVLAIQYAMKEALGYVPLIKLIFGSVEMGIKLVEISEEDAQRARDKRNALGTETGYVFQHKVEKVKVENGADLTVCFFEYNLK